jgi:hypothetical protein
MPTCETCKLWRPEDRAVEGEREPKHPRGRCGSLDERVPVGPGHGALSTFHDFGCVAHEPKDPEIH